MAASLILRTVKGTPLTNLEVDNNFSNLSTFANTVDSNIGVLSSLTTTNKGNIVIAVNELVTSNTATNSRITSITSANIRQFAVGTSADLAAVISDETGSGKVVFATSPVLTTPSIGLATGTSVMLSANIGAAAGNVSGNFTAGNFQSTGNVNTASALLTGVLTAPTIVSTTSLTTKKIVESVVAIGNTGTAATIDLSTGTVFTATLNGSATLTITNAGTTSSFVLVLTNDGTAGRTVAFAYSGGSFKAPNGSVSRTTTANATDVWFFFTPNGGTTWYYSIPMTNLS